MSQGLVSLLIPIIVIILAMGTKKIISSLIVGILAGGIFLAGGNIINGCIIAVEHLVNSVANEEKASPRSLNLDFPLALLIISTFFFFWYTGKGKGIGFLDAIMNAEFEKSILLSGVVSIVITTIFYLFQKIPMDEIESHWK